MRSTSFRPDGAQTGVGSLDDCPAAAARRQQPHVLLGSRGEQSSQAFRTTQAGSGTTADINIFQDGVGLQELWAEWYGTTQSDIAISGTVTPATARRPRCRRHLRHAGRDGCNSDLNWGSEGRINSLTLGNNNNWVNGNANTWINGEFKHPDQQQQHDRDRGQRLQRHNSNVVVTTTIWGVSNNNI